MPPINPTTDKRRSALDIIARCEYMAGYPHLLSDADIFRHIAELGYYWDKNVQDWLPMPETKEG